MFRSYRTTFAGIAAILTAIGGAIAVLSDGDPSTMPQWEVTIAALASGWGLLVARDNVVSSEHAGARR